MLEQPHTPPPSEPGREDRTAAPPAEYETERWKHQVEAEAKHELKREIHGVGAGRP